MIWNECKLIYNAMTEAYSDMSPEEEALFEEYKNRFSYDFLGMYDDYPYLENWLIQRDANAGEIYPNREYWRKYSAVGQEKNIFRIHESGVNIWYDKEDRAMFSALTCVRKDGPLEGIIDKSDRARSAPPGVNPTTDKMIKTSLSDTEKPFILDLNWFFPGNSAWGVQSVAKHLAPPGQAVSWRVGKNAEIVFKESPGVLEKIVGKRVLLIGAGPSLEGFDYDLDRYDTIVTCNNFLMHDKVSKLPIDLLYLSNDTYTKTEVVDYVNENPELGVLIDTVVKRNSELVRRYVDSRPDNVLVYNTRIFTRTTGVAPRLIALLALLGAREISFVGVDGQVKEDYVSGKSRSVFEKDKEIPSHHCDDELKWFSHNREFVCFWDYVLNYLNELLVTTNGYAPVYRNLGENYEKNMMADISKQMFPLEEKKQ